MNIDMELEVWRQEWQSEATIPPDLRRKVERQSRLMKVGFVADALVTVVMGGGTTAWAAFSSKPEITLVAVATWLFLAVAWAFVLTVNRGLWAPSALDAAAFMDISVRRCQTTLATIWFAVGLFLSEVAFGLSWSYIQSVDPREPLLNWLWFSSWRIDFVWLCTLAFFGGVLWYRRKKQAELACLLRLREEMDAPTAAGMNEEG